VGRGQHRGHQQRALGIPESLPKVTQGLEGVAGLPRVEEDHRRLQRHLPAARVDEQQGHEVPALAKDPNDHRVHF